MRIVAPMPRVRRVLFIIFFGGPQFVLRIGGITLFLEGGSNSVVLTHNSNLVNYVTKSI